MTDKKELRAFFKERRLAIPEAKKKELDRKIVQRIAASAQFQRASAVFLYAPVKGEINLLPLAHLAQKQGKKIAFPRCDTETEEMRFFELLPEKKLITGAYGIPEPPADAPLCVPDTHTLCVLPALSCDAEGHRLGYGKGYYDKYLQRFDGMTVCAVYGGLLSRALPFEAHDIPAQYICTEDKFFRARKSKDSNGGEQKTPVFQRLKKGISQRIGSFRHSLRTGGKSIREQAATAAKGVDHAPLLLVLTCFVLLLLSRIAEPLFTRDNEYAGLVILQILIFVLPAMLYCKLRSERFTERIRLRLPKPSMLLFLLCALITMICGGLLSGILTGGIGALKGNFTLYTIFVAKMTPSFGGHLALLLAYAFLPAFAEELIFRAILCAEYEKHGVGVAVTVSALLFSMLHFSFPHFLTYFLLGAILALTLYVTRSFFAVFLLHLLYNVFCLYGQPYLSAFYVTAGSNEIFVFCLVVIALLAAAFGAGEARKLYHGYAKRNLDSSYTKPLTLRQFPKALLGAILSPVMAICGALWLVFAIVNLL